MSRFKQLSIDVTVDFIIKLARRSSDEVFVLSIIPRYSYNGTICRNWNYHRQVNFDGCIYCEIWSKMF